jgi:hypothetical protein
MPGFGYSGYYLEAPGYSAQPGFIEEPGTAATPRRAAAAHHRSMYMYAPVQGGGAHPHNAHPHKKSSLKTGLTNNGY